MGRPRKRRREEAVEHPEVDPWGVGNGVNGIASALEQSDGTMPFAGMLDPQFSPSGIPQADSLGVNSADVDLGSDTMGLDLPAQLPHGFGSDDFGNSQANYEYLSNTSNLFPDLSDLKSGATQLQTPSTVDHHTSDQDPSQTNAASCSCLPELYRTLASFSSLGSPSFPYSLGLLKQATNKGPGVLKCDTCPQTYNTALQNSMMLGTLINLIICEHRKLLKHIDERSEREERIAFRMGEQPTPEQAHLHTGTVDCPMGVSIDLSGAEWRTLARKAVRKEVFGDRPGDQCLALLLDGMKERQVKWHNSPDKEHHEQKPGMAPRSTDVKGANGCICTQVMFIDHLKRSLDALGL